MIPEALCFLKFFYHVSRALFVITDVLVKVDKLRILSGNSLDRQCMFMGRVMCCQYLLLFPKLLLLNALKYAHTGLRCSE
jgi:hypothetical protein